MVKTKNYVELTKIPATAHIESVTVPSLVGEVLAHGQFINLGAKQTTNGLEAYAFTKAEEGKGFDALIDETARDTGEASYKVYEEVVVAGKTARAYVLQKGDVIAINEELASGVAVNEADVTLAADGLGFKTATLDDVVVGRTVGSIYRANVGKLVYVRFV